MKQRRTAFSSGEPEQEIIHVDMWWDDCNHPLTDDEFIQKYCEHELLTSDDRSIKFVRNKAYIFIHNFMIQDIKKQLAKYRQDFPCT